MHDSKVISICIGRVAGAKMEEVTEVIAEKNKGLVGDRYYSGNGSFNKSNPGKRQITFMNAMFFEDSGFNFSDSRRNIFTEGVELMDLIGKEFSVGEAGFRGVKYCDPCNRPNTLTSIKRSFREAFFDRGGLVAEIIESGIIRTGDKVRVPKKDY